MAVESTVADSSESTAATPEPVVVDSAVQQQCVRSGGRGDTEQASPDSSSNFVEGEQQARPASAPAAPASVIRSVKEEQEHHQRPPRIEVIVAPRLFQPEFRPAQQVANKQSGANNNNNNSSVVSSSTSPDPCFSRIMSPIPHNVMGPPPPPPPQQQQLPPALLPAVAAPPAVGRPAPKAAHQRIRKSTAQRRGAQQQASLDHEEPSSSIPEIEFDGTTVLCRVCGDKASGFHYGVHSCEGCKGFFRRSIQQKIQYRPCTKNQQCSILRINRNRCQYCRLKKCVAVGMSRDAVRFGRVPKREKAKILAAMQSVNARLAEQRTLPAEFSDDVQLMQAVVRAHMETCDFTRDKVQVLMAKAHQQPNYTACPPTLACPLNPTPAPSNGQQQLLQDFSERFLPAIRDVVEFAKRLPGFSLLAEDDKVTLLKPGVFEVLLVRLAAMFDSASNTMLCLNGQLLRRDALQNSSNARFLMDSMFEFAERLNSLQLNDAELGLFCAVVVVAADRPGLRNVELVERMQAKLRSVLDSMLSQAHPDKAGLFLELLRKIPDLRTLNTLHSEKLLAFKMTEQQQQQQQQQAGSPAWLHQQQHSSDSYDEEGAKSPMGSVSSSGESACSTGEVMVMSDLPLLAAVAGSAAPLTHHHLHHHHRHHHRRRPRGPSHSENGSSSMSSDGEETDGGSSGDPMLRIVESPASSQSGSSSSSGISAHHHLHQNGMTIMGTAGCPYGKMRKLDSPDDSGIESGVDRYEKLSTASRSTNTSLCSSPRSSLEDKVKDVEDMHNHPGSTAASVATSSPNARATSSSSSGSSVDDMPVLKRVLQAPPLFDTNSLMDEAYKPHKKFRALTLQQRKGEADVPTRVPVAASTPVSPPRSSPTSVLSAALSTPPATSSSYSALCNALTSGSSTLTSTHSTLARSLMEGPKLLGPINVEQQRRADLIVANIMRGTMSSPSPPPPPAQQRTVLTQGPLYVASSSSPYYHQDERRSSTPPSATAAAASSSSSAESQPLNLSLKSPSSSPARSTTPVATAHYFPQIHA